MLDVSWNLPVFGTGLYFQTVGEDESGYYHREVRVNGASIMWKSGVKWFALAVAIRLQSLKTRDTTTPIIITFTKRASLWGEGNRCHLG